MRAAALILLLGAAAAGAAEAQVITGRLMEAGAVRPIGSAFIELLDSSGVRQVAALTDSAGRFVLTARTAGEYRLRAERIGYESVTSPVLRLGDTPVRYEFVLKPQALTLPPVDAHVEESRGCERRPDGRAVYALWHAIRQALTVAAWTSETRAVRYSMMNHVRELDPSLRTVLREKRTPKYALGALPYSSIDADHLARNGYVLEDGDGHVLLGPDANTLLSETFLDSHCFRLVSSRDPELVGLGFEPLRGDDRADVSGVLWVDRRTSELQHLAFEYENLPEHMRRFGASGAVHFERMASGIWIVRRWWIRSPIVAMQGASGPLVLIGHREDGGTVTSAEAMDTQLYRLRGRGSIEGVVMDSARNAPMPDALVFLSGTPFTAPTDANGRYRLERIPDGSYTIGFTHPVLEELAVPLPLDTITVTGAETLVRSFAAPSMSVILRALCPGEEEEATTGLLYGMVRGEAFGEPLQGVEVRASWEGQPPSGTGGIVDRWRTAHTDVNGRYFMCWIPTDRELRVRIDSREVQQRNVILQAAGAPILRRDFD